MFEQQYLDDSVRQLRKLKGQADKAWRKSSPKISSPRWTRKRTASP